MYHFKFKHDNEKNIFIRKFEKLWSSWDHIFDFLLSKFIVYWFFLVAFFGGFGVFFGHIHKNKQQYFITKVIYIYIYRSF